MLTHDEHSKVGLPRLERRPASRASGAGTPSGSRGRVARALRAQVFGVAAAWLAVISANPKGVPSRPHGPEPFEVWRSGLIDEAVRRGFSRELVSQALGGVRPLSGVLDADRAQAKPGAGRNLSLSALLTPNRVAMGRKKMREQQTLLARIERWFGVQRRFVVAIWGLESSYGSYRFDVPTFQALATLAWEPRRAEFFRAEVFDAFRIAQRGHIDVRAMRGSWAGAMGQPQFMPSSYIKYAFDFDSDGRRDIWQSTPDALASIANYLRSFNWRNGETWGREVTLAADVRTRLTYATRMRTEGCSAMRTLTHPRPLYAWAADGVRLANGGPLPRARMNASLVVTADARSFLVYRNYEVILAYNCSHSYALSVAMLADQIR